MLWANEKRRARPKSSASSRPRPPRCRRPPARRRRAWGMPYRVSGGNAARHARRAKEDAQERLCGALSGIPACCIEFFMTGGRQALLASQREWYERLLTRVYAARLSLGHRPVIGYVACPSCLRQQRFTRIRDCSKHLTVADFVGTRRTGRRPPNAGTDTVYEYRCSTGCQRVLWLSAYEDAQIRERCQ